MYLQYFRYLTTFSIFETTLQHLKDMKSGGGLLTRQWVEQQRQLEFQRGALSLALNQANPKKLQEIAL